ncbi:unnamed protein product [Penicillium pancosmium]
MSNSASDFKIIPTSSADMPTQTSNANVDPNSGYASNDNHLAGLVEAATAAADHDVNEWAAVAQAAATADAASNQLDGYSADMHLGDDTFSDAHFGSGMGGGRHLRVPNDHSQSSGLSRTVSKKRKRNDENLDPQLAGAGLAQQHYQPQTTQHGHSSDSMNIRSVPPQSLSEARAVGVHSAAALFRQPSTNKKQTRPPMSKLFSSLELSPENFLHLQAAAKSYMLNDDHPERRDCVGQRGKGDTEMVKLRLWNCARTFLDSEGNGDRLFGENVVNEGMGPRTYIWPRDSQKIISLVIPLLRRMVTNERQRQYAIETRKGGGPDDRRRRKTDESFAEMGGPRYSPEQQLQMHGQDHRTESLSQSMPPPPSISAPQPPPIDPGQPVEIGLTDLLMDGYTVDWNEIARSYDMYNQDYELDNLWSVSGLQQPDWRGLVAAVDSHYYVIHNGHYECPSMCEDENINRIIHSNTASDLSWRIGGGRNLPARDEFASSITRDVSRIIRENIASRESAHNPPQGQDHHFPSHTQPTTNTSSAPTQNPCTQNPTYLRINIVQQGKRILPRLDLPASQCPDVETVKHTILRRYPNLSGSASIDNNSQQARETLASWKVKAWLPQGLVPVQADKEWTIALLTAETTEWMDGDLKVLVETEGNTQH